MIGFLYFLLVFIAILAVIRVLPLAFLATGYFWLWTSHRWVLIGALIIGAAVGIWRSLSDRDEPTIHPPSSTGLPTRHRLRQRLRRGNKKLGKTDRKYGDYCRW